MIITLVQFAELLKRKESGLRKMKTEDGLGIFVEGVLVCKTVHFRNKKLIWSE